MPLVTMIESPHDPEGKLYDFYATANPCTKRSNKARELILRLQPPELSKDFFNPQYLVAFSNTTSYGSFFRKYSDCIAAAFITEPSPRFKENHHGSLVCKEIKRMEFDTEMAPYLNGINRKRYCVEDFVRDIVANVKADHFCHALIHYFDPSYTMDRQHYFNAFKDNGFTCNRLGLRQIGLKIDGVYHTNRHCGRKFGSQKKIKVQEKTPRSKIEIIKGQHFRFHKVIHGDPVKVVRAFNLNTVNVAK